MDSVSVSNRRRILCVFPRYTDGFATFRYAFRFFPNTVAFMPPQGILVIAAYLPKQWEVKFVDENVRPASDEDYRWADAVLVSGMHAQKEEIETIVARAHRQNKLTVIGGPSVSACPEYYPDIDILQIGELGDATDQIIARIDQSIARPAVQEIYKTTKRLDLDDFPMPAYHMIRASNYLMLSIQWSSGCPFACEFCDIPALYGRVPRYKSPEHLCAELDELIKQDGLGAIFFVDDNLIGNKKAFRKVLPHLVEWQRKNGYPLRFIGECSVNVCQDHEVLAMMREAHFTDLYFGIETTETDALVALDKKQNTMMPLVDAINTVHSYGITIHGGIIVGLDTDTEQTVDQILSLAKRASIPALALNVLYAPPKTPLWDRLESEGRLLSREETKDSNVIFKAGEEVVMARWRRLVTEAFEPAAMFDRFRGNIQTTYKSALQPPLKLRNLSPSLVWTGLWLFAAIFYHIILRAPYRWQFLRLAYDMLRAGQVLPLLYAATSAYHFIKFREEVMNGTARPCMHTEVSAAAETPAPPPSLVQIRPLTAPKADPRARAGSNSAPSLQVH